MSTDGSFANFRLIYGACTSFVISFISLQLRSPSSVVSFESNASFTSESFAIINASGEGLAVAG